MTETTRQAMSYDEAWRLATAAKWKFESYYKYSFTFGAEVEGFSVAATVGGLSDDIYRYTVTSGEMTWTEVLGGGECRFRVVDAAGNVAWEGWPL